MRLIPVSFFLLLLSISTIAGCSPTIEQRGNLLENHQLDEAVPGVHTRSDILRILGSPTTVSTFDPSIWYYIGQETEKRGILDPEVTKERIIVAKFDDEGILESLKESTDGRIDIPVARDKTATHGNDMTMMQQFLGNLGRFNPQEQK